MRVRVSPPVLYTASMDTLFHRRLYWTRQNGFILFNKKTGEVWVRGYKQTSRHVLQMWADALAHCPGVESSTWILLLGLAGGGALSALHHTCRNAQVTAVEHDPTMVTLARELHQGQPFPFPDVLVGDAQDIVSLLQKQFDLILVDLSLGGNPPAFTKEVLFWSNLKGRLFPGGKVVFNLVDKTEYDTAARASFEHSVSWTFRLNRLVALWDGAPHTVV